MCPRLYIGHVIGIISKIDGHKKGPDNTMSLRCCSHGNWIELSLTATMFSVAGPETWNGLRVSLYVTPSTSPAMFSSGLKTVCTV